MKSDGMRNTLGIMSVRWGKMKVRFQNLYWGTYLLILSCDLVQLYSSSAGTKRMEPRLLIQE